MTQLKPILISLVSAITLVLFSENIAFAEHQWPVDPEYAKVKDLSSTFGPRLKASENFRYDFHRGVDIPAPMGTPVYAIADGVVRLAGDYTFYSDTLVQIRHYKPGSGSETCSNRGCYYSNYMHLSGVVVSEGDDVSKGDVIGYTGASESGFEHLHFEIRDEGLWQMHAIHPLVYLPYNDISAPSSIRIDNMYITDPFNPYVNITVEVPDSEVDLNRVEVFVYDESSGIPSEIDYKYYDMMEWNYLYTPKEEPNKYLDNPDFNGIYIDPERFNASSYIYTIHFIFKDLKGVANVSDLKVKAKAIDINGGYNETTATFHECPNKPTRINREIPVYYDTLQEAYNDALDGETIQSQELMFMEDLTIGGIDKYIIFEGGYNCDYTHITGMTRVKGTVHINSPGVIKIKNFKIEMQ